MLRSFQNDRSGTTAIEYGLIVGLLGVGLLLSASKARDMIDGSLGKLMSAGDTMSVKTCSAGETCDRQRSGGDGRGGAGAVSGQALEVR